MISVSGKNWEEVYTNKRLVEKIKIDHGLNDIQSKIVLSRNYTIEEIYLIKNKINLKNPFYNTKDFVLGCELLNKNLNKQNKILIIGDYDVDGCMSTSLLVNFLKQKTSSVNYYIPDRFKDFISTPKPNGYQSIHTTVIGKDGIKMELQIRTKKMHQLAEYGVASHWIYKDKINEKKVKEINKGTKWFQDVLDIIDKYFEDRTLNG